MLYMLQRVMYSLREETERCTACSALSVGLENVTTHVQ